ncbi:hypothetical protein CYMTET_17570 [Cymbomonas tetramitiformis]|uniref:Polycystin cation channel PKD1/PKD2 domain-containing protein n=1 Tax=Cymbomonas tetramitiformis TaxID=36881 RepID=A0AAE0GAG3_9CHLO|nr:hypothetical protein CYMTET_17570 [Cymbomonas tetramitiformis]
MPSPPAHPPSPPASLHPIRIPSTPSPPLPRRQSHWRQTLLHPLLPFLPPAPPPPPLVYVDALQYEEYEPEASVDTDPPIITRDGEADVEVVQHTAFEDPGVSAFDERDGYVAVTATWTLNSQGLDAIDVHTPTQPGEPYILMYRARDAAGNEAQPVERHVAVVSPCASPSFLCEDGATCARCSWDGAHGNFTCLCLSALDEQDDPDVAAYEPPEDVTAPIIVLLGDGQHGFTDSGTWIMIHNLTLGSHFDDPGVEAYDLEDGDVTGSIRSFGLSAVNTDVATGDDEPYVVTYSVADRAGNEADAARRRIYVYDPCPGGRTCGGGQCGDTNGLCPTFSLGGEEEPDEEPAVPPALALVGSARVTLPQGDAYVACTAESPVSSVCDRGATAWDELEGDLGALVLACSPDGERNRFEQRGVGGCSLDTGVAGVYPLTFEVFNSAGAAAPAVVRNVTVEPHCPPGESLCLSGVGCSTQGVCVEDLVASRSPEDAPPENAAPAIALRVNEAAGSYVSVAQYSEYSQCAAGSEPTAASPCESGATAMDDEDGDLTGSVLACPPAACLDVGCPGHEFATKGVQGCLDTAAEAGTIFEILFMVLDRGAPALNATATRTITIDSPCEAGQELCLEDRVCSSTPCDVRASMQSALTARRRALLADEPPESGAASTNTTAYSNTSVVSRTSVNASGAVHASVELWGEMEALLGSMAATLAATQALHDAMSEDRAGQNAAWEEHHQALWLGGAALEQSDHVETLSATIAEAGSKYANFEAASTATAAIVEESLRAQQARHVEARAAPVNTTWPHEAPEEIDSAGVEGSVLDDSEMEAELASGLSAGRCQDQAGVELGIELSFEVAVANNTGISASDPSEDAGMDATLTRDDGAATAPESSSRKLLRAASASGGDSGGSAGGSVSISTGHDGASNTDASSDDAFHDVKPEEYARAAVDQRHVRNVAVRNTLLGGMLLRSKTRQVNMSHCSTSTRYRRFYTLLGKNTCPEGDAATLPRGKDPVFSPSSSLYNPEVAASGVQGYYNATPGSEEVDLITGIAHPFQTRPEGGLARGAYPFFFDVRAPRSRAREMYSYLEDGMYLQSGGRFMELQAELLTYNSETHVMAHTAVHFRMQPSGSIAVTAATLPLPFQRSAGAIVSRVFQYSSHLPVWVCAGWTLVVVGLFVYHVMELIGRLRHDEQIFGEALDKQSGLALVGSCAHVALLAWQLLRNAYTSEGGLLGHTAIGDVQHHYDVYDNLFAEANFLLPLKMDSLSGGPFTAHQARERWRLQDDDSGLAALTAILEQASWLTVLDGALRGLEVANLLLLFVRLSHATSFHRQMSFVQDTIRRAATELLHLFGLTLTLLVAYSCLAHIVYGAYFENFSTSTRAITSVLQLAICGDWSPFRVLNKNHSQHPRSESFIEHMQDVILLNTLFFIFQGFMLNVLTALINTAKLDTRPTMRHEGYTSVLSDALSILTAQSKQRAMGWPAEACILGALRCAIHEDPRRRQMTTLTRMVAKSVTFRRTSSDLQHASAEEKRAAKQAAALQEILQNEMDARRRESNELCISGTYTLGYLCASDLLDEWQSLERENMKKSKASATYLQHSRRSKRHRFRRDRAIHIAGMCESCTQIEERIQQRSAALEQIVLKIKSRLD